ncbi:hypothetical protein RIF29_26390 [Crotalaria pallida]|uniref:Uncharacterized protein n=1 Tax=Crotalaria pallida TaxID=3830 RepID=A0AAN9EML5_CROPI
MPTTIGSRYAPLGVDTHVVPSSSHPTEQVIEKVNPKRNLGHSTSSKPKPPKANNTKPIFGQIKINSAKPKVQTKVLPPPTPSSPAGSKVNESLKHKENEILRIMSWKEKELLKAFKETKDSMEFLNQFVHKPSEEEIAFVENLRARGTTLEEFNSKPPDLVGTSGTEVGDGDAPGAGLGARFAQRCDGATVSNA